MMPHVGLPASLYCVPLLYQYFLLRHSASPFRITIALLILLMIISSPHTSKLRPQSAFYEFIPLTARDLLCNLAAVQTLLSVFACLSGDCTLSFIPTHKKTLRPTLLCLYRLVHLLHHECYVNVLNSTYSYLLILYQANKHSALVAAFATGPATATSKNIVTATETIVINSADINTVSAARDGINSSQSGHVLR